MDWAEKRKRRDRNKQMNLRLSIKDQENIQSVLDHLQKISSWGGGTKTDALLEGITCYQKYHKIEPVTE